MQVEEKRKKDDVLVRKSRSNEDVLSLSDLTSKSRDFYESDTLIRSRFVVPCFDNEDREENRISKTTTVMRSMFRPITTNREQTQSAWKLGLMSIFNEKWSMSFESMGKDAGLEALSLKHVVSFEIKDEDTYASITLIFDTKQRRIVRVSLQSASIWRKRLESALESNRLKSARCHCSYDNVK